MGVPAVCSSRLPLGDAGSRMEMLMYLRGLRAPLVGLALGVWLAGAHAAQATVAVAGTKKAIMTNATSCFMPIDSNS